MSSHKGQTGQVTKVRVDSAIEQVYWTRRQAAPGGTVGLEVFTRYVGNGADLKIELTDNAGKGHGSFTDKIHGNHFWAAVKIPSDAKDALVASVKLSKHSLQQKSPGLLLLPPVQITNVTWDRKEARRGDTLKLTADVKGPPDGSEAAIEIYERDAEGAHEQVAKIPVTIRNKKVEAWWEFQYHDDTKDIPSAHETEKGYHPPEYFFRVAVGEVGADSGPLEFKDWIEVVLHDGKGNPIGGAEYVLYLPDGSQKKGKLNQQGSSIERGVPPGVSRVEFSGKGEPVSVPSGPHRGRGQS